MRRFLPFVCALGLPFACDAALAGDGTIAGRSLRLDTPCLGSVVIGIDASLHAGARFSFDGSGLEVRSPQNESGDDAAGPGHDDAEYTLAVPACGTGTLHLALAPDTGLAIAPSRTTRYVATGTLTALSASLAGGSLDLGAVRAAHLGLSGEARVHIGSLDGALQVSAGDRASLVVDHAHAGALSGQFLGHAQASVSDARLNAVSLVTAQSASVTVLGEAQVATLTAHGDSVINIESVTGALLRHGDGNVRVSRYNGMIVDRRDTGLPMPGGATPGAPMPGAAPPPPVPPPSIQPPGGEQP